MWQDLYGLWFTSLHVRNTALWHCALRKYVAPGCLRCLPEVYVRLLGRRSNLFMQNGSEGNSNVAASSLASFPSETSYSRFHLARLSFQRTSENLAAFQHLYDNTCTMVAAKSAGRVSFLNPPLCLQRLSLSVEILPRSAPLWYSEVLAAYAFSCKKRAKAPAQYLCFTCAGGDAHRAM